jgi:hypothetical protein
LVGPNDVLFESVDQFLDGSNQVAVELEDQEGGLHMLPGDVEVLLPDGHVLVEGVHIRAFVVVGAAEEMRQELHHGRMQLRDVRYVFQEEVVDTVISQDVLVKLRHHFLQLIMATYLLKDCRHRKHCK